MTVDEFIQELKKYPADMTIKITEMRYDVEEHDDYPADVEPCLNIEHGMIGDCVIIRGKSIL